MARTKEVNVIADEYGDCFGSYQEQLLEMETLSALKKERDTAKARVLEQAAEIMTLQADCSTLATEVATLRGHVAQAYRDGQGHNHCWRNIERLFEQFGLKLKRRGLPPLEEFKAGCEAFQCELYEHPERWPDFIPLSTGNGEEKENG